MVLKDICHSNFMMAAPTVSLNQAMERLLAEDPAFILVLDGDTIQSVIPSSTLMKTYITEKVHTLVLGDLNTSPFTQRSALNSLSTLNLEDPGTFIILMEENHPVGVIDYNMILEHMTELAHWAIPDMPDYVNQAASLTTPVLIQGEIGVGKDFTARNIHSMSSSRTGAFIKINCSLIPKNRIDGEIFGYEEDYPALAARNGKKSKIQLAEGGTLFLDEISYIPERLQLKLQEFLSSNTYTKIGGTTSYTANVRIISASKQNLAEMIANQTFRSDLFDSLNGFHIDILPLNSRMEEIPSLADSFISRFNTKYNLNRELSPEAVEELYEYPWPGNVRELEYLLERLVVMSDSDIITIESMQEALSDLEKPSLRIVSNGMVPYKDAKRVLEKYLIPKAFALYGSTYKAADALGIDQSTVSKLLKKYKKDIEYLC